MQVLEPELGLPRTPRFNWIVDFIVSPSIPILSINRESLGLVLLRLRYGHTTTTTLPEHILLAVIFPYLHIIISPPSPTIIVFEFDENLSRIGIIFSIPDQSENNQNTLCNYFSWQIWRLKHIHNRYTRYFPFLVDIKWASLYQISSYRTFSSSITSDEQCSISSKTKTLHVIKT